MKKADLTKEIGELTAKIAETDVRPYIHISI